MPRSSAKQQGKTRDLHGIAPDECRVALLIIDMINAFDFDGADAIINKSVDSLARAQPTRSKSSR